VDPSIPRFFRFFFHSASIAGIPDRILADE
jgi:hypothetical protein